MSPSNWQSLLAEIAVPRLPGSSALRRVQQLVTDRLEDIGYTVSRQRFDTRPRRLYAASVLGSGMGMVAIVTAPVLVLPVAAWSAVLTGVASIALVLLVVRGIAEGRLPLRTPQVAATNLTATKTADVDVWLVAHSDSKAQALSLAGRVITVTVFGVGCVLVATSFMIRVSGPVSIPLASVAVITTALTGAVLSRGPLRGSSPGAVDNASGLIAVLSAAHELRDVDGVGVLITDAEEYGMEGARAWIAARPNSNAFVNFDGIDSAGKLNVMMHRARQPVRGRLGSPIDAVALAQAIRRACVGELEVRRAPLPLGVFVDGSVLARGGMAGVTVSRGDWGTLRAVHTPRDTPERLDPVSAATAGRLVAHAMRDLFVS